MDYVLRFIRQQSGQRLGGAPESAPAEASFGPHERVEGTNPNPPQPVPQWAQPRPPPSVAPSAPGETVRTRPLPQISDAEIINYFKTTELLDGNTKKIYLQRLGTVQQEIMPGVSLMQIIANPEGFQSALHTWASNRTKALASTTLGSYPVPFISLIKSITPIQEADPSLFSRWKASRSVIMQEYEERVMNNQMSEKQAGAFLPFTQLEQLRESLPSGSSDRLLLSLYTMIPPVRADFGACAVYRGSKPATDAVDNYIVLDGKGGGQLHIGDFKTRKTNPPIEENLPKSLVDEIEASLKESPREWLFQSRGQPLTRASFTAYANRALKRVTGRPGFSITQFRHIYLSRPDLGMEDKTLKDKDVLAKSMGHSLGTQARYAWRKVPKSASAPAPGEATSASSIEASTPH